MKVLALALLLPATAVASGPHEAFMAAVPVCFRAANDEASARACIGTGAAACFEGASDGQTTVGMMECLLAENTAWDGLLNAEYAAARQRALSADDAERPSFPEFAVRMTQLRDAQRAWIAYRDANCAMEYGAWGAGSLRLIAGADCQLRMTAERAIDLRSYLSER